eukprot:15452226-Alexandrium_andersonii.AAC.1
MLKELNKNTRAMSQKQGVIIKQLVLKAQEIAEKACGCGVGHWGEEEQAVAVNEHGFGMLEAMGVVGSGCGWRAKCGAHLGVNAMMGW